MKTYFLFIFHTQINISCKECNIVIILAKFTSMYTSKNLKNATAQLLPSYAPAQCFPTLAHCKGSCLLWYYSIKLNDCTNSQCFIPLDVSHYFRYCKSVLEMSQSSQENLLCHSLFFNKVASIMPATKRETLAQVFSCEFSQIFKNTSGLLH